MRTRRSLLAGLGGAVVLAGCTGQQGGGQTEINAPEPDTLQDQPILYHGQTYQLNNEAYTVPDTLDRGPQTITTDQGQTIQAYINNAETYEESIAWQFTRDDGRQDTIRGDHHNPVENGIQVDGDTIYVETETETTGNDLSNEIAQITGGIVASFSDEDNIPYNFEITVTDGNGTTYSGTVDSDMSQDYIDEEETLGGLLTELGNDMGI